MTKKYWLSLCAVALSSACNLAIDTDEYPYQQPIVVADMGQDTAVVLDEGMPLPDMPADASGDLLEDMGTDQGMVGTPELMITEVFINPSLVSAIGNGEIGEFIEVKNIGTAPADPRRASFQIVADGGEPQTISVPAPTNSEQLAIYMNLQPIQPGEYFVYVRFVSDGLPLATLQPAISYFDYGRSGVLVSLANSGSRTLTLQYFDGKTIRTQDSIRWSSNALRPISGELDPSLSIIQDVSLSVGRDFENRDDNDTPANWCAEITEVAGPDTVLASPGGPSICSP